MSFPIFLPLYFLSMKYVTSNWIKALLLLLVSPGFFSKNFFLIPKKKFKRKREKEKKTRRTAVKILSDLVSEQNLVFFNGSKRRSLYFFFYTYREKKHTPTLSAFAFLGSRSGFYKNRIPHPTITTCFKKTLSRLWRDESHSLDTPIKRATHSRFCLYYPTLSCLVTVLFLISAHSLISTPLFSHDWKV